MIKAFFLYLNNSFIYFRIVDYCSGRVIHPGPVQSIIQHPTNEDKILIGYKNKLIVHWDLPSNSHDRTYIYKQVCYLLFLTRFLFRFLRKWNLFVGIIKE